jgi:hypothetical protein
MAMNTEIRILPHNCDEWFMMVSKPEVTDADFVPDIPLELLPTIELGERIWPRVFPGL